MHFFKGIFLSLTLSATAIITTFSTYATAAESTSERFNKIVETAAYKQGIESFTQQTKLNNTDNEATFALGALQFLVALEGLQQDLYRYGAGNAEIDKNFQSLLPVFRVPVAPNPSPEAISYEKTRELLETFVSSMEQAIQTLETLSDQPVKLTVDLLKISLDADQSGTIEAHENVSSILGSFSTSSAFKIDDKAQSFSITFDQADTKWLQGYSNLLMSAANFLLAFDYENTYDITFHNVFGASATQYGKLLEEKKKNKIRADLDPIISPLNFIHSINWKIESPDRLKASHQNMLKVMQLNYETWELAGK